MNKDDGISIASLYPGLTPEEQEEARENLKNYLKVVKSIYDGLSDKEKEELLLRVQWEKRNKHKKD